MNLKLTRSIIDAIHDDILAKVPTKKSPLFGLHVPETCPGVPTEILDPRNTWQDKVPYKLKESGLINAVLESL